MATAAAGGVTTALLLGGVPGLLAGAVMGIGLRRMLTRLEPATIRRLRARRTAQLPIALDLLAVCLRSGSPLVAALETVGAALPGPLGTDLSGIAGLQRLGAGVAAAWSAYDGDPVLDPVARLVRRSASSGSGLALAFERLADDRRTAAAAAGQARARRAAVTAAAPLGLCFLPAFACLVVVPIVASIAGTALN